MTGLSTLDSRYLILILNIKQSPSHDLFLCLWNHSLLWSTLIWKEPMRGIIHHLILMSSLHINQLILLLMSKECNDALHEIRANLCWEKQRFDTHYYIVKLPHLPSLEGPSFLDCTHVLAMCNTTDAYMLMPANVLNLKPLVITPIPSDQGPLAICPKTALHMWNHLERYLVSEEVGPLWEWNGSKALIWIATLLVPKLSGPHYKSIVCMPDFVESSISCPNLTLS